ncbi:uncharacterized protein LOC130644269 [Hydractinia symbiolongicarpus]|uniref:uncharacterized protein LOC130644269 n=1 Tax=Hydractinia symbiolongicarpus TaxID=13093 RepID=UPI00254B840B|nr:uncharacterized protein LOC130644269 [Hydractinia symbiolongicarpus]
MKTALVIALLCIVSAWSYPAEDEYDTPACDEVFRAEICEAFDSTDELSDEEREKRQLPGLDKDLLERLLLEKLKFLTGFGLLKNIPFIGQFVHDLVERDPEGVSKAISGGIFAIIPFVLGALG